MPTVRDLLFLSGDLFLPKPIRTFLEQYWIGNDQSLVYITNWSILHMLSGIAVGYSLNYRSPSAYYWTGFLIHTAWELWQILVKNTPYWTLRGRVDVVTDTGMFMGGMFFWRVFTGNKHE
jgi:hypothetical protein